MVEFQKFFVEYDGIKYVSEFDTKSVKRCEELGVFENRNKPIELTFLIFYSSIMKNHPMTSMNKVREFYNKVIDDSDYGITAFEDIVDEFFSLYNLLFTGKGEQKKFKAEK